MPPLFSLPRIASCIALCALTLAHADPLRAADIRHRLAIASWNLEWLADPAVLIAANFWGLCKARGWPNEKLRADLPFCDVYRSNGIETAADYAKRKLAPLRRGLAALAARQVDILAVQEVQRPSALTAVLPTGYRIVCFTTRSDAQNVGFAVRIAAAISPTCREIAALSLERDPQIPRPVRRGLELALPVNGATVTVLNVHLKSGCSHGRLDNAANDACIFLQHQAAPLEEWIETQASAHHAFVIVGDWNRDLEEELAGHYPARTDGSDPAGPIVPAHVRNLFPEINDGAPPASTMTVSAVDRSAADDGACRKVLDQLVVSDRFKAMLDPSSLAAGRVRARLVLGPDGASDHCALEAVMRMKQ